MSKGITVFFSQPASEVHQLNVSCLVCDAILRRCYPTAGSFRSDEGPAAIAQLVDRCLDDNPGSRPTAKEVLDVLLANKPTFGM